MPRSREERRALARRKCADAAMKDDTREPP